MVSLLFPKEHFDADIGAKGILRQKDAVRDLGGLVHMEQGAVGRSLAEEILSLENPSAAAQKHCRVLHPSAVKTFPRQIDSRCLILLQEFLHRSCKLPVSCGALQGRRDGPRPRLRPVDHRTGPAVIEKCRERQIAVIPVLAEQHAGPPLFGVLHQHVAEKRLLVALAQDLLSPCLQP